MTKKKRILIIDDDPGLLRMIGMILHKAGYEVYKAENGEEGLKLVSQLAPDLVVLDVMMPDMSGLDVCRRIRTMPPFKNMPIILLSALERVDDKVEGFEAGADDYVSKPVAAKELLARTKALLSRASIHRPSFAKTVTFFGAKGGVGVTSTAVNVAVTLANRGESTVLAEMSSNGGSVYHQLKLNSDRDLGSLLPIDPDRIRRPEVERCVAKHSTGLQLFLAPRGNGNQNPMTIGHLERIFDVISTRAKYIIVDLPTAIYEYSRRMLELSDKILLVTGPEFLSVACAKDQIEIMKDWGVYERVYLVVVNRARTGRFLGRIEIENHIGMGQDDPQSGTSGLLGWQTSPLDDRTLIRQGVVSTIPADPELYHEAVQESVPVVLMEPNSSPARNLVDLTELLIEDEAIGETEENFAGYSSDR